MEHYPIEKMIVDYFAKLQGGLFKKLSAVIMEEMNMETFFNQSNTSELKERVVPTIDSPKSEPYDDVKNKVISDVTKGKLKQTLDMKNKDIDTVTYADVVKGKTKSKNDD